MVIYIRAVSQSRRPLHRTSEIKILTTDTMKWIYRCVNFFGHRGDDQQKFRKSTRLELFPICTINPPVNRYHYQDLRKVKI